MLDKFRKGPKRTVKKLNAVIDSVNALSRIAGDQFIHITKQGDNIHVGFDIAQLLSYLPRSLATRVNSPIRKAYVKTTPAATDKVDVYLDENDSDTEVEVTCSIVGGSALNSAIPRITDDDLIFVLDGGTMSGST